MSTTEKHPRELLCAADPAPGSGARPSVLTPREVPLGGPRAMTVRRTLPQRARSLIGPWCFVDHFGPDDVAATGGMAVPRHPHTGLATVTLLFEGQIDHVDSTGFANTVRPGEVNLMIAGRGVSHSEFSTARTSVLHGVQLWYALPDAERGGMPASQHHVAPLVEVGGAAVRTYLGPLAGAGPTGAGGPHAECLASPIETRTPALAAEILLPAGAHLDLALDPTFEHGLLVDTGAARLHCADAALDIPSDHLAHIPEGAGAQRIDAGQQPTRLILVGGPPFAEEIVMWWNFVGRTHEEIVAFRAQWQREIGREDTEAPSGGMPSAPASTGLRFGPFPADTPAPLPAPTLPNARIAPRRRPRRSDAPAAQPDGAPDDRPIGQPSGRPAGQPSAPPGGPSVEPSADPHEGDPR
ncbi:pirin family protein [Brachybacterium halotolerans subsp. kimchii]|uniref:pirin family protein n=1 Tax=Brachybacterium halotolerans TaxID=2795215 RepID=UPI001E3F5AD6|nr:pirin family protein [Brachybacterium halotolerans]UEJ81483.1 pirin family protein [Brachybacterium halotolerans subsp. kimchii]